MKTKSASLDTTDKGGSFFVTQPTQAVPRRPETISLIVWHFPFFINPTFHVTRKAVLSLWSPTSMKGQFLVKCGPDKNPQKY
jgi:hypothetical protein